MSVKCRGDLYIEEVNDMRIDRRWFVAMAILFLPLLVVGKAYGEAKYRWDIIFISTFDAVNGNVIDAGGMASASAQDTSKITLTGSGTFTVGDSEDVTGGGTWQTVGEPPASTINSGDYRVTGLVRFDVAPGAQASNAKDHIGDGTLADNRGGLAILRIAYSDGSKGILAVSCDLPGNPPPGPAGSPHSIFEGITASKGFVDYWNRAAPAAGVNGNRTLFHVVRAEE
jgi:hypothetical protein